MLLCLGKQKPRLSDFLPFQLQDVNRMYACGEVRGCLTVWPKGRLWSLGTSSTLVHLVALAVAGIAAEACVWCDTGTSSLSLCPSLSSPALPWAPTTITYSFDSLCDSHFILAHLAVPYPPHRHSRSLAIFSRYSQSQGPHVVDGGDSKVKPPDLPPPGRAGPTRIDMRQPATRPLLRVSDRGSGRRTLFCRGGSPAHLVHRTLSNTPFYTVA